MKHDFVPFVDAVHRVSPCHVSCITDLPVNSIINSNWKCLRLIHLWRRDHRDIYPSLSSEFCCPGLSGNVQTLCSRALKSVAIDRHWIVVQQSSHCNRLTVAEHFIVGALTSFGVEDTEFEVDGALLFFKQQQILCWQIVCNVISNIKDFVGWIMCVERTFWSSGETTSLVLFSSRSMFWKLL